MANHQLDTQLPEKFLNKIKEHDEKIREMRTLQQQGMDAVPRARFDTMDGTNPGNFVASPLVTAGNLHIHTLSLRHDYPTTNSSGIALFEPSVTIYIDTNNSANHRWPNGNSLTAAQKNLMVSLVRDPAAGLAPGDAGNNLVYHLQLYNLDTVSHTYYCTITLHGEVGRDPFQVL